MTRLKPTALLSAIIALLGLAACGSSQTAPPITVTVPGPAATATGSSPAPAPQTTSTETTQTQTGATPAPTRTAPAPAFTRTTGGTPAGGDLQAAVAKLSGLGFTPVSTSTYDPNQTLRVLIGARSGSAGAHAQRAFFFDGARYLGTDAADTSGMVAVTGHGDTDVTLRYAIYRPGDADCCPSGGSRAVRFALDGGRLVPLDPIPATSARR